MVQKQLSTKLMHLDCRPYYCTYNKAALSSCLIRSHSDWITIESAGLWVSGLDMFMRSRCGLRIIMLLLAKAEDASIMLTTQNKELHKCDGMIEKACQRRVGCVG